MEKVFGVVLALAR